MRRSRESNPGPPALQANTLCKEPFEWHYWLLGLYYYSSPPSRDVASSWLGIVAEFDSDADIFDRTRGGPNSTRGSKAAWEMHHVGVTTMEGLDQGHLHPLHRASESIRCSEATVRCETRLMRRSRESNPGPPALQANTLCKEPFKRHYWLLFGTLACTTT